ncbi:hypothetical protein BH09PSE5_BH09PSE5_28340 [soil metagenome]
MAANTAEVKSAVASDATTPAWLAEMRSLVGKRGVTFIGPDPVNVTMIRHWCAAMGDRNPIYADTHLAEQSGRESLIAPPAMLQVWTMPGYGMAPPAGDPAAAFHALADAHGLSGIVATNCEQEYLRELRVGDIVKLTKVIDSVSDEKKTALGGGVFLTTRFEFTDGNDKPVARMLHRVLRFKPASTMAGASAPVAASQEVALRPRANQTQDIAFYFQAARQHRLEIQRCVQCQRLRHPPTAGCPHCGCLEWDAVTSTGRGSLFSFTTVYAPVVAPFKPPYVVGLVALEEGVRVVTEIVDVTPDEVKIGMELDLGFTAYDAELVLPVFRPRAALASVMEGRGGAVEHKLPATVRPEQFAVGDRLSILQIPISRTQIVATAIATRDYQEVHHDPDIARQRGSQDVFVNILTTTGLVGRDATDSFGPAARLRNLAIKLGATAYPGDTLTLQGHVLRKSEAGDGTCDVVIAVRGTVEKGDHVTGEVTLSLPARSLK